MYKYAVIFLKYVNKSKLGMKHFGNQPCIMNFFDLWDSNLHFSNVRFLIS